MRRCLNGLVTVLLWVFFSVVEALLFAGPFLLAAVVGLLLEPFKGKAPRQGAFQTLNHYYYRLFFLFMRILVPHWRFEIPKNIRKLAGTVVVCNHVSYLDSILMVAVLRRHRTVVKDSLFKIPYMGWAMKAAGYLSNRMGAQGMSHVKQQLAQVQAYLRSGGNLFVFPEGTRKTDAQSAAFRKGAFAIAHRSQADLAVLAVSGTDRIFRPGSWLFNACEPIVVKLEMLQQIPAAEVAEHKTSLSLMREVQKIYSAF
jgi:1-acyl-sn-glycerol-3-phosphate acyltransferase